LRRGKLLGRVPTEWYPTALAVAVARHRRQRQGRRHGANPKRLQPDQRGNPGRDTPSGQLTAV